MINSTWLYSTIHQCPCKVIEEQNLWGETICRIWLPTQDTVVRVPKTSLQEMNPTLNAEVEAYRIQYIANSARIAELLENSSSSDSTLLLAPMESDIIPLPHQIQALSRIISGDRIRFLLADEVGLGKTIEAGLVIRELKLRGLIHRILIVTPKGLATQWVSEMRNHFNESFHLILGEDLTTLRRINEGNHARYWAKEGKLQYLEELDPEMNTNSWHMFDQVIVSMDSVKPIEKRRGWNQTMLEEYNQSRFENLITAGWDLVIIDESHRLGGSTDQVARYKLGLGLSEAAPYLLLLSATPHQGKSDAFQRLMSLLDPETFPDIDSITKERVLPYIIRTEKRKALTMEGNPLFTPRMTQTVPISWENRYPLQQLLYDAVTEYVRKGYNQAIKERKQHLSFLMILMQRLVVSSTRAIKSTLERRLNVLQMGLQTAQAHLSELETQLSDPEMLFELDSQELLDDLLQLAIGSLVCESEQVKNLLEMARKCELAGPDAKAEDLIHRIYELQGSESEPDVKVLLFTEFTSTQSMLKEFLDARGISTVTLNGSMDMMERKRAQDNFQNHARVLISTDAGGEGLNLQFCHVVVNYDLPWNPMRLEQRIGRVDRIGQTKKVVAINFLLQDTVEFRVREILEKKLAVILDEFGIDKTSDVLNTPQSSVIYEGAFTSAILNPDCLEESIDHSLSDIREEIRKTKESSILFDLTEKVDVTVGKELLLHPLPYWLERLTTSYLLSHGGKTKPNEVGWDLTWPDGKMVRDHVFHSADLENLRICQLIHKIPTFFRGQSIPCTKLKDLPNIPPGFWGLFEIQLQVNLIQQNKLIHIPFIRKQYFSLFSTLDDKIFLPTSRYIWDSLQSNLPIIATSFNQEESCIIYDKLLELAKQQGQDAFDRLLHEHQLAITREKERGQYLFQSRKNGIERLGLPEVRQYRMKRCITEEEIWRKELETAKHVLPEIRPLLLIKVDNEG